MAISLDQIGTLIGQSLTGAIELRDATLIRMAPGTRTNGAISGGTNPTPTSYACKAIDDPSTEHDGGTLTRRERNEVDIVRTSLPAGVVPEAGDRVTVLGATYEVIAVGSDAVRAVYSLTVAGA